MKPLFRAALFAAPFLAAAACGDASSEVGKDEGDAPADQSVTISETDMVIGDPKAPVTLIEYASVTCPHCATFNQEMMPVLKEKYIDTGKLKLVFREFPTPPVNYSLIGSVLARCAADKSGEEAYFLITDALFRNQRDWVTENARPELEKIVAQAGMDSEAIDACLAREEFVKVINANATQAMEKYDISGTPSFILNGEKIGFSSKEEFEKKIAEAVEKAGA